MGDETGRTGQKPILAGILWTGGIVFHVIIFYYMVFQSDHLVLLCSDRRRSSLCGNHKKGAEQALTYSSLQTEKGGNSHGIRKDETFFSKQFRNPRDV